MKKRSKVFLFVLCFITWCPSAHSEDWKGESDSSTWSLGALTGLGLIDSSAGYALLGTVSKKIAQRGFIPDINDSVSIEGQFGPIWFSGVTAFYYSVHLRWDFQKDANWIFYALGGIGGNVINTNAYSSFVSRTELFPRLGVGAFWKINSQVWCRAEVSHELIAVGALFPF
jgi:hypothetical protein